VSHTELERCRAIIARQVTHMATLLDDLLDISRFTSGEIILRRVPVSLKQVVDTAIETAQPLIDAKKHRLQLDLPSYPILLHVDSVRLSQVLSNLLANAAKYTDPEGHIHLGCRLDPDALIILVRDTGIGLAPDMHTKIFDIFVQAEPAKERSQGGLGIGLALVKAMVELHGGQVGVQSNGHDQGCQFTVKLPRSTVIETDDAVPLADVVVRRGPTRRILIADDNRDAAESLGMLLQVAGHEVHVACDGAAALELAERLTPDVAVLDIGMPGLNGYEVAERIRGESWGREMFLIAMTGWGQQSDKDKARLAGFNHHLTKPTDPNRLEQLLTDAGPTQSEIGKSSATGS
jgi:CheY-like chemotaxis protein